MRSRVVSISSFFNEYSSLFSTILAVTNLYLVYLVFRFERRTSQSKVSVSPLILETRPFNTAFKIPIDEKELILKEFYKIKNQLDNSYFLSELTRIEAQEGLPSDSLKHFETTKILGIAVKNNGDTPSSNVRIKLKFNMYGSENFYPREDINLDTFIDRSFFKDKEINIVLPYMGANEERFYKIFELKAQFRETELILLGVDANGFSYVKTNLLKNFFNPNSEIILNHYKHPILDLLQEDKRVVEMTITVSDLKEFYGFLNT